LKWLFFIVLLLAGNCYSQESNDRVGRKYRDSVARVNIQAVTEGCLLVRLRSDQKKIQALVKRGDTATANKEERKRELKHLEIVSAFNLNYTFSKVYYFYSHHSARVRSGDFSGVLLDDLLTPVELELSQFLIVDPYSIEFVHMNSHQKGLSVLNKDLVQLEKPFPYYVRKREALFFLRRDHHTMVKILQKNFEFAARKFGSGLK